MSTYTETTQRLGAILRAAAHNMRAADTDQSLQRLARTDLAAWLRVLGFKADARPDGVRVFGALLFWRDDLWQYCGEVGAVRVAHAIADAGEAPPQRRGDDELSSACWPDGQRLTMRELRAWCRA